VAKIKENNEHAQNQKLANRKGTTEIWLKVRSYY